MQPKIANKSGIENQISNSISFEEYLTILKTNQNQPFPF